MTESRTSSDAFVPLPFTSFALVSERLLYMADAMVLPLVSNVVTTLTGTHATLFQFGCFSSQLLSVFFPSLYFLYMNEMREEKFDSS